MEAQIRAAADANGETLTGFVLAAAAERVAAVQERTRRIAIAADAFERFVTALDDEPAAPMPVLHRYAHGHSLIPQQ